jgi:hypothetical protein
MTTRDIIVKVKKRVNKEDTEDFDNLSLFSIIEAYNKAQLNILDYLTGQKNQYQQGSEATTENINKISSLINKKPKELALTKEQDFYFSEEFPQDYFKYVASYSTGYNDKCSEKKIYHNFVEESNINLIVKNENQGPSFEWSQAPLTIAQNTLKIHTDNKFNLKKAYLTYYRYPVEIDIQGYIKSDGTSSTTINPELPKKVIELIIDEAVRIIQGDIQNPFGMQVASQNLLRGE